MTDDRLSYEHDWEKDAICGLRGLNGLDPFELSLFEWYAEKNETIIEQMLSAERTCIECKSNAGRDCANDSEILAADYYIKRARYASVTYMTSLLETNLAQACKTLTSILGEQNVHFKPDELVGNKWNRCKKFLERYGKFKIPEEMLSEIQTLHRIRNIIVHKNGDLSALSESERNQVENINDITLGRNELEIEKGYVMSALSSIRALVEFISGKLDGSINHRDSEAR